MTKPARISPGGDAWILALPGPHAPATPLLFDNPRPAGKFPAPRRTDEPNDRPAPPGREGAGHRFTHLWKAKFPIARRVQLPLARFAASRLRARLRFRLPRLRTHGRPAAEAHAALYNVLFTTVPKCPPPTAHCPPLYALTEGQATGSGKREFDRGGRDSPSWQLRRAVQ